MVILKPVEVVTIQQFFLEKDCLEDRPDVRLILGKFISKGLDYLLMKHLENKFGKDTPVELDKFIDYILSEEFKKSQIYTDMIIY